MINKSRSLTRGGVGVVDCVCVCVREREREREILLNAREKSCSYF